MGLEVGAVWVAESWKCQRPTFYKEEWAWPWGAGSQPRDGFEAAVADVRAGLTDRGGLVVRFSTMGFYMFGRKA